MHVEKPHHRTIPLKPKLLSIFGKKVDAQAMKRTTLTKLSCRIVEIQDISIEILLLWLKMPLIKIPRF
jgi:hypothetical protein